jgi:hypothetical protein
MGKEFLVSDFQAEESYQFSLNSIVSEPGRKIDRVKTEDVRISMLIRKLARAASENERAAIRNELNQVYKVSVFNYFYLQIEFNQKFVCF